MSEIDEMTASELNEAIAKIKEILRVINEFDEPNSNAERRLWLYENALDYIETKVKEALGIEDE
jgi:hypothetical protein